MMTQWLVAGRIKKLPRYYTGFGEFDLSNDLADAYHFSTQTEAHSKAEYLKAMMVHYTFSVEMV